MTAGAGMISRRLKPGAEAVPLTDSDKTGAPGETVRPWPPATRLR